MVQNIIKSKQLERYWFDYFFGSIFAYEADFCTDLKKRKQACIQEQFSLFEPRGRPLFVSPMVFS